MGLERVRIKREFGSFIGGFVKKFFTNRGMWGEVMGWKLDGEFRRVGNLGWV